VTGDHQGLLRAWQLRCDVHLLWCRSEEARQDALRAMEHARLAGRNEGRFLPTLVSTLVFGPTPVTDAVAEVAVILERPDLGRYEEAASLRGLALLLAMQGRFEESLAHARRSLDVWADLGSRSAAAAVTVPYEVLGWLATDPAAAEAALRDATEVLGELEDSDFLSTVVGYLGQAVYHLGRPDEAGDLAGRAEGLAASDDIVSQVVWRQVAAKVHARRGDHEAAERLAAEAVSIAERTDQLAFQADSILDLAEVLSRAGRVREAGEAAEEALARYERKGDVASAAVARARVEALGSDPPQLP
jgi:tetratricopeptide (TPR) repeat protein